MSAPSPSDAFDFSAIHFPSDRLSLGDLRRVHPEIFDDENADGFGSGGKRILSDLDLMMHLERVLALAAYEKAKNPGRDVLDEHFMKRADFVEGLVKPFAAYGIATGPHQVEKLVRDIETQAAAQVRGPKR